LSEKGQGFRSGKDAGGFDGFAANRGVGILQGVAEDAEGRGMVGRIESECPKGEGADGGRGIG
jgi:hypothetical protein